MELLVICDIDETIADNSHRHHLLDGNGTDREQFMRFLAPELVAQDVPVKRAREVLEYFQTLEAEIIFLTGRGGQLRQTTLDWLNKHFANLTKWRLITRGPGDEGTTATEYKTKKLDELRQAEPVTRWKRWVCFDDDRYLWPVYRERYKAIVFQAPYCWAHLFPDAGELPPEANWRR
jgi:predicted secreted acid phosphatase